MLAARIERQEKERPSDFRGRVQLWCDQNIGHIRYALCSINTCPNYEEWPAGLEPWEVAPYLKEKGWRLGPNPLKPRCPEHASRKGKGA